MVVRIVFVKIGNITLTTLLDIMLDERASRTDIEVTVFSSSTKLKEQDAERLLSLINKVEKDLIVVISPNANLPGPQKLVSELQDAVPLIIISDAAKKELRESWKEKGIGYIIAPFDPMIGAKRDFLDPAEMGIFNGQIITIFSVTGVFTFITKELDKVISELKAGNMPKLPSFYLSSTTIIRNYPFANEYSRPKAIACLEMLKQVGKINTTALYSEKDRDKAILLVAAAHEMVDQAASLAKEIRELEKSSNHLVKQPHSKDGALLHKVHFFEEAHKQE
ncbi:MAG: F420-dependent methylenetetrahydromethanopterin dehydrogenase [Candidatus Heimdallarchaeaceae archaeon]